MIGLVFSYSGLAAKDHYPQPHELPKKIRLNSLEREAKKHNYNELLRAIQATRILQKTYKHPGIKKRRFLQAALYIETHPYHKDTPEYLTKKKTKVKHTIEYDPTTNSTFVVLDSKKAYLGRGAKKTVYKAILYNGKPKVVARSEQSYPMDEELHAHKALRNTPGIMNTYAFTKRKAREKKYTAIYSDLYEGTLEHLLRKKKLRLYNKVVLMHDLLTGLESLHSRNFVHRDLHTGNYLIRKEKNAQGKRVYRGVIADLGRTITIDKATGVPAQMTRRVCAPEGFSYKSLKEDEYFSTDIYALGCIFYRIYHNKIAPWQGDYLRSHSLSQEKKKTRLLSQLRKTACKRRKTLLRKKEGRGGFLSIKKDLELLILNMVHPDPNIRSSASDLKRQMHHLLVRLG